MVGRHHHVQSVVVLCLLAADASTVPLNLLSEGAVVGHNFASEQQTLTVGFKASWQLLGIGNNTYATFSLECTNAHYCALGISPHAVMAATDAWMCWDDPTNNAVHCSDAWCSDYSGCPRDHQDDITVLTHAVADHTWNATFARLISAGEEEHDYAVPTSAIRLVFATGPSPQAATLPTANHYQDGSVLINWRTGDVEVHKQSTGFITHLLIAEGILFVLLIIAAVCKTSNPTFSHNLHQGKMASIASGITLVIILLIVATGDILSYRNRKIAVWISFGGMTQMLLVFQFLSKLKKASPLLLLNTSSERAHTFHCLVGTAAWITATLHMLGVLATYMESGNTYLLLNSSVVTAGTTDGHFSVNPAAGIAAWTCHTLLAVLAVPVLRRHIWEFFYNSHIALALTLVICTIVHGGFGLRTFILFCPPLLLYIADTCMRWFSQIHLTDIDTCFSNMNIAHLTFRLPKQCTNFRPGSHLMLVLPCLSTVEAHPCTIITGPKATSSLVFVLAHEHGSWSHRLVQACRNKKTWPQKMRIEGPYGGLTFEIEDYTKVVLLAGGIGVTFALSVLEFLRPDQDCVLVWSVRDSETLSMMLKEISPFLERLPKFHVVVHYTSSSVDLLGGIAQDRIEMSLGHPIFPQIAEQHCTKLPTAAAVCGPTSFSQAAHSAFRKLCSHIPLHIEKWAR
ncbi:hypothetical protein DIPPA_64010 [Diplonema papillatum]|nr:hypothetical protein DIPPA_64010 [Diplonema papillatum]